MLMFVIYRACLLMPLYCYSPIAQVVHTVLLRVTVYMQTICRRWSVARAVKASRVTPLGRFLFSLLLAGGWGAEGAFGRGEEEGGDVPLPADPERHPGPDGAAQREERQPAAR